MNKILLASLFFSSFLFAENPFTKGQEKTVEVKEKTSDSISSSINKAFTHGSQIATNGNKGEAKKEKKGNNPLFQPTTSEEKKDAAVNKQLIPDPSYEYKYKNLDLSIMNSGPDFFEAYLDYMGVSKRGLDAILENPYQSNDSLKISIVYYDSYLKQPSMAAPLYKELKSKSSSIDSNLQYADFLLRTGHIDEISPALGGNIACITNFKMRAQCQYYLGIAEFLKTGKNKNQFMMNAKDSIPKAKLIYEGKL